MSRYSTSWKFRMSTDFGRRLKIGLALADQLTPLMTRPDVGKRLVISKQAVRVIEGLALYKVWHALRTNP